MNEYGGNTEIIMQLLYKIRSMRVGILKSLFVVSYHIRDGELSKMLCLLCTHANMYSCDGWAKWCIHILVALLGAT